jgi:very-short-patch-repair endonuclease
MINAEALRPARGSRADRLILSLAARQHGIVARCQLLAAGLSPDAIDHRLATGLLVPVFRGVYRVGPLAAPNAGAMAALLACGDSAVISHRSAAVLLQILPPTHAERLNRSIDVTVPSGNRSHPGVRLHRVYSLHADEVTTHEGIRVTTSARTLLDLAACLTSRELEQAMAEALAMRSTTEAEIRETLARHRGGRGTRALQALLADGRPALTRSQAEERFLALIRKAKLPMPEANVVVERFEVDCYWREERLVAEVDGFAFHSSAARFESDRRRDATLAAAGVRVIRVTWRQLCDEPEAVAVRLGQALVRPTRR